MRKRPQRLAVLALALLALSPTARAAVTPLRPAGAQADGFVSLRRMAAVYGARAEALPDGRWALVSAPWQFEPLPDGRRARLMGALVWLQHPLTAEQLRAGALHRRDAVGTVDVVFRPYLYLANAPISGPIVLDPGHGGVDGGATGFRGLLEKQLTLDVARRVRARLAVAGLKVEMTREDDRLVELDARAAFAAARGASLLVSIHFNAATETESRGVETYVLPAAGFPPTAAGRSGISSRYAATPGNAFDAANAALGFQLQRNMVRAAGTMDRGLKRARFLVLRDAPCPAALVECGFLTNPVDAALIADPAHRQRLAEGIARGILEYHLMLRRARAARLAETAPAPPAR